MKLQPHPVSLSRVRGADHGHLSPEVRERDGGRVCPSPVLLHHHLQGDQQPHRPVELCGEILHYPQAGRPPPTHHDTAGNRPALLHADNTIISCSNNNINTKDSVDPMMLLYADDTVMYYTRHNDEDSGGVLVVGAADSSYVLYYFNRFLHLKFFNHF